MTTHTLLIELGTEELPPKALKKLSAAFTAELLSGLKEAELVDQASIEQAQAYASPRRLALSVPNVVSAQPDQTTERRGPAVQAAFKDDGSATPAAMGFAKSCGVEVEQLQRLKTDKGEWLSYEVCEQGKTLSELVQVILEQAIKRLPIPKRMRWGSGDAEFVRPVKWLVVMHGSSVIPAIALGVASADRTRGHRFHSGGDITISHADSYEAELRETGHVIADFDERQAMIKQQVLESAEQVGGHIEDDQALLDEVTGLVEYPSPIIGHFEESFLDVPQECLVSSMRDHQKYFHIVNEDGALVPHFITISNIQSSNPKQVQEGNEKVLRARLSDAQFFWETDQKSRLEDRIDRLDNVTFHAKLGSMLLRTQRLQRLAGDFAEMMNADTDVAKRGALLAKADLVSDMVGEFDELQGIMGHYYADREGEAKLVGECIEQHYWPKFAGDHLPASNEAQAVALADRLDSFVGLYGAGERPTGDKDPYGLRRAALSVLRILIERGHEFSLPDLVSKSAKVYSDHQDLQIDDATQAEIVNFIRGRLTAFYQAQDIPTNTINAVLACEPDSPLDFDQRVKAVHAFSDRKEAANLAEANKRAGNILKKQSGELFGDVDTTVFSEVAEKALYAAITDIETDTIALFQAGNYEKGLEKLSSLRDPVAAFFKDVKVMADNDAEKRNRLALLKHMQSLFLRVADIALLG